MTGITPSQTVGPYFKYGLTPNGEYAWNDAFGNDLVTPDVTGERIRIEGQVFDGDGQAVADAMLEIWQADGQGRFGDPQDAAHCRTRRFVGSAVVAPINTVAFRSVPSSRDPCPVRVASHRRRTLSLPSMPGA